MNGMREVVVISMLPVVFVEFLTNNHTKFNKCF